MKLHDMRRSDDDRKDILESRTGGLRDNPVAEYPEGLRLDLDHECLKRMGVDPQHGEHYRIEGEGHVSRRSQEDTDQQKDRRVTLTLHKLGAERTQKPPERAKTVREDLEDARHLAGGTYSPSIGSRFADRGERE